MDGTESETGIQSPTSEGSTKDGSLIIAPIQVIIPFDGSSDEDSDREEEQKRQVRQKKKKARWKATQTRCISFFLKNNLTIGSFRINSPGSPWEIMIK